MTELNLVATNGTYQVSTAKDPKNTLSFDASLSSLNGRSVGHSVWSLGNSNPNYYVLTTSQPVPASNKLSLGLTGSINPGASLGMVTVSSTVLPVTIREARLSNNIDADKVKYFQQ